MSADDSSAGVQPGVLEVPPDHGESLRPWIPAAIIAVSCALNLVLLFDWWPSLRGIGWRWDYVPPSATLLVRLLPAVVVLAVYCAGLIVLRRCADWLFMTWSIMGAIGVPVTLLYLIGDPLFLLFSRTVSQYATGAFAASLAITDPSRTLAEWPAMMPGMRASLPHMAISSPAWGFIYYGFAKVLALNSTLNARLALPLIPMVCQEFGFLSLNNNQIASTWLGIASPLWAALTVIPIHNLGVQIGGRRLARHAIAWWPLVPALAMFAATLNSVYPLFTTTAVALYFSSLRSSQDWLAHAKRLAVGLLLGLLLLWNFSLVPVLLLCGILALAVWGQGPRRSRFHGLPWLCLVGLEVALGLILVWGLYTLKAGHSPLNLLLVSMRSHLSVVRPYLPWLGLHTWDIVLFAGLPASALAIVGLFVRRGDAYRQFALALGLTLVILVLSGTARGETGRVWMFFMPLILLLTAGALISLGLTARIVLMGAQFFGCSQWRSFCEPSSPEMSCSLPGIRKLPSVLYSNNSSQRKQTSTTNWS